MEPITNTILKAAGMSAALMTTVVIIGGAFFIYKTVRETELLNLQIQKLKHEKESFS